MNAAPPDRMNRPSTAGRWRLLSAALALSLTLSGCSLAPTYHRPAISVPAAYQEAKVDGWVSAKPGDHLPRGDWWTLYHDPVLDRLEHQLDLANPDIATALARYEQASAFVSQQQSGLLPQISGSASPQRNRESDNRPLRGSNLPDDYTSQTVGLEAGLDLDLWGRIRNEVVAGKAQAQAAQADLASARLSLEAQLADGYILLRGYDVQTQILANAIDAYTQALQLAKNRFEGGIASALDVTRARALLDDAQAQASEVAAQRALSEHALATLIGEPASNFHLAPEPTSALQVPDIPLGLPSTLLQRRPDIASAERNTFAANAGIGVARAAFFPDLSISAMFGWQNTGNGSLLSAGNRFWALGPLASLDIFDGGYRRAQLREAKATLDEAAGRYRSVVLTAFQQVEDNLVLIRDLGLEAQQEEDSAQAALASQTIATNRYREGTVNYLDVVTAQTVALQAERNAEQVRIRRLQASVNLIRALGGGWDVGHPGSSAKAIAETQRAGGAAVAR